KANSGIYRTVTINGKVPFQEAQRVFIPSMEWTNYTLQNDENVPFLFYLETGINRIGLEVNSAPFREIYETVNAVMIGVNDLALDIKKLTGNQIDENRDWEITDYLPNIESDITNFGNQIKN